MMPHIHMMLKGKHKRLLLAGGAMFMGGGIRLYGYGVPTVTLHDAARRIQQGHFQVTRCHGRYQICFAEMLCIPQPHRRLQGWYWHVPLHHLQQSRDFRGHIRGTSMVTSAVSCFASGCAGSRTTNDARSSSVSNSGASEPLAAMAFKIFWMPVERPPVRSSSFRNSPMRRLRFCFA
jgi:hypothetical protein